MYDGTGDLDDHFAQYKQHILTVAIPKEAREATMCKGFGLTLIGPALQWYINLPNGFIHSFAALTDKSSIKRRYPSQLQYLYRDISLQERSTPRWRPIQRTHEVPMQDHGGRTLPSLGAAQVGKRRSESSQGSCKARSKGLKAGKNRSRRRVPPEERRWDQKPGQVSEPAPRESRRDERVHRPNISNLTISKPEP